MKNRECQCMNTIKILHKGKKVLIPVRRTGVFSKYLGLMFRSRHTSNLLFEFTKKGKVTFTSLFVFFRYLTLWLDERNHVLAWEYIRPFRIAIYAPCAFSRVVEVPVNTKNESILRLFRRKRGNV